MTSDKVATSSLHILTADAVLLLKGGIVEDVGGSDDSHTSPCLDMWYEDSAIGTSKLGQLIIWDSDVVGNPRFEKAEIVVPSAEERASGRCVVDVAYGGFATLICSEPRRLDEIEEACTDACIR